MKKSFWIIVILVVVVLVGYGLMRQKKNGTAEEYTIGAIVPLSGNTASVGVPFSEGMKIAVDEINEAGGINGKPVYLYFQDGEFSGTKTVSAAEQLISAHNPDVFDVLFNLPAQAASSVFRNAEKPFLEWDYSRSVVDANPFAFKTGFDAKTGCEELVRYAQTRHYYKKLGVLMSKTPYNQSCFEGVKNAESNVNEYWYTFGSEDFKTLLGKVYHDGVDAVVLIPIDPEPVRLFKQLRDLGYPIKVICATASECIYPSVESAASPKTLEGTLSVDFLPKDFFQSEFSRAFEEKFPNQKDHPSVTWAALGYNDVMTIMSAMKSCDPGDSKCITRSLNTVKDASSIIGSNGFQDRIQDLTLRMQIYEKGKWVDVE